MARFFIFLGLLFLGLPGFAAQPVSPPVSESVTPPPFLDESALDKKADPCTDFYQYACGGWIQRTEIPADRPGWSRGFYDVAKRNEIVLRDILQKYASGHPDANDHDSVKLGDYYGTCMDEKKAETASMKTLRTELSRIDAIEDPKALAEEVAHLHLVGADVLFSFGPMQDRKDSSQMIAGADQGGLGLPDRDYYLKDEGKMPEIRKLYLAYIAKLFTLSGTPAAKAEKAAKEVLSFETALAKPALSRVELRDPQKTYHRIEKEGLMKTMPYFFWDDYFKALDYQGGSALSVSSPEYFKALNGIVRATPLERLRTYLRFHLLSRAASQLGKRFVDAQFQFTSKALTGAKELPVRWKRCVKAVDGAMGEPLGRAYVNGHFPPDAKTLSQKTVQEIEAAFHADLDKLSWMDDATRKQAYEKLSKIVNMIGYPDKWRNYDALKVTRESYLKNSFAAAAFNSAYEMRRIGKPVDRKEWDMTPPTVNAYYSAENNQMVFPAGILQSPFFNKDAPRPVNYGGIGMVMGHELTHGFDDEGRQYDGNGNLREWWTPKVAEEFGKRASCLVNQYSAYVPVDSLHLNGKLTLGENIADQGGIKLSWTAFLENQKDKPSPNVAGLTPKQQFFVGFAQSWCTKLRPEYARMLVTVDPHSPAKFRVNGPLANFAPFAEVFGCKTGTAMAPKNRCEVW